MDIEELFMVLGVALGIIPLVGIIMGYFKLFYLLPMLVAIFIILFVILLPLIRTSKIKSKMLSLYFILIIIVAIVFFVVMFKGAFEQQWLENHDPYGYSIDALYIAEEHTTLKDKDVLKGGYLEPDPPGYSVFMAFFYQMTGDMNRTLKFMNVLVLSLGIIFAYLFFKEFTGNNQTAFFAAFILAVIPSFLTRFIFATSLAMSLFFPALFAVYKSKDDKYWIMIASMLIASILMTHHLSGFVFGIFFIILLAFDRNKNMFFCGLVGFLLSLIFWVPNFVRYGYNGIIEHFGFGAGESVTKIIGSATRAYGISDFFNAPAQNLINTATGWGPMIFILVLSFFVLILLKRSLLKEKYIKIALVWFFISLVAVNAFRLPFMLMPFRWWTFLAIPLAIIVAESLHFIANLKWVGMPLVILLIAGIAVTSGYPKYQINTSQWMPSASLMYPGLMEGHLWIMDNLPKGTHIYSFNQGPKLAGFNMYYCAWCKEDLAFEDRFLNVTPIETKSFMEKRAYDYLLINSWYYDRFDKNLTSIKIREILESNLFVPVYQNEGMVILEIGK